MSNQRTILEEVSILYVTADPANSTQMTGFLGQYCPDLHIAADSESGLDIFYSVGVDIVIIDLPMPKMGGFDMARKIRDSSPEVPVLLMSSNNETNYLMEAIKLGLDQYLPKPIEPDMLLNALMKATRSVLYRKKQEKTERELHFILDQNPNFIIIANEGKIEYINRSFLDFLGIERMASFFQNSKREQNCNLQHINYPCLQFTGEWFYNVIQNPQDNKTLCVCSQKDGFKDVAFSFLIKVAPFPDSNKYLLSFNNVSHLETNIAHSTIQAAHDPLTGIANRTHYNEKMAILVNTTANNQRPFSLIFFDIDQFKIIKQDNGIQAADLILKEISTLVKENIRKDDIFARIGEDRFAIIAPDTEADSAYRLAEKIRSVITAKQFSDSIQATCSFGITQFHSNDIPDSMNKRCDDALYAAKNAGQNQSVRR